MSWFFAILVVLLIGAVAVVATGAGGSMAETYDDRADARVRADGPLTADDLRRVRFTTAFRGYRMSEVDTLLARLADELDAARQQRDVTAPQEPRAVGEASAADGTPRAEPGPS